MKPSNGLKEQEKPKNNGDFESCKVLIIGKDSETNDPIHIMFSKLDSYDGCRLDFIKTYDINEAKKILKEYNDIAVILFDVSMEENNGLDFVKYVRNELSNHLVRLIIHSASASLLDKDESIMSYDIDDFKENEKLTLTELYISIINSIDTYRNEKIKQALTKEIHCRVKNNLQMLLSILKLQKSSINSSSTEDFIGIINRINSLVLIQERLDAFDNLDSVSFFGYIQDLVKNLCSSNKIDKNIIKVELDIDKDICLSIDSSIPCGLIIHELVSNSLEHAFSITRGGILNIHFHKAQDENLILEISDNGIGLSKDIDIHNAPTLGLTLVDLLAQQLEARITVDTTNGTRFKLQFKEVNRLLNMGNSVIAL